MKIDFKAERLDQKTINKLYRIVENYSIIKGSVEHYLQIMLNLPVGK